MRSLVEVGYRSEYGISQEQHKVALLAAEHHEKLASEYKQRMVRKEAQVESLLSRLADVKNDLISQAILVKDNLKAEQSAHEKTREELLESRTQGERLLVAYNSIQAEYLSISATLKVTKHDLDTKTQEGDTLQEELNGALEIATQLRDSINALEADKADLQFAVSLAAIDSDSLRTRLSELEVTRGQISLDLQAAKEELSQERLTSEARVSEITASLAVAQNNMDATKEELVVAQAALDSKTVEVDYLTTARLLAETAYGVESSQRLENTRIFDAERARLRNSLSAARAEIKRLEIISQDAEKMNQEFERKVQELLESHSEKEQKLLDAVVTSEAELASERLAKEGAFAEIARLKTVLAARDGAHAETLNGKLASETKLDPFVEILSKVPPIVDTQPTSFSENVNDTLLVTSLSDKENCEVVVDDQKTKSPNCVADSISPPFGFNSGNVFDPRYSRPSGSSGTHNDIWSLDDQFTSCIVREMIF